MAQHVVLFRTGCLAVAYRKRRSVVRVDDSAIPRKRAGQEFPWARYWAASELARSSRYRVAADHLVCARWRRARRGHLSDPAWSGSDLLAGWNGPEGRTLKANQYLHWQAIAHLKQRGLRWFDLGGFNEE